MDDRELEAMLESSLSQLPPEETIVRGVTPWRQAFNRILWGMGLTTITLNFLGLNILLPAIGNVLTLLGYRALRRENRSFTACYWISIFQIINMLFWRILDSTIWGSILDNRIVLTVAAVTTVLQAFQYLLLRQGIRTAQKKAGLEPHAGSAAVMAGFQIVLLVLALLGAEGIWILGIVVIYGFMLRSLFQLSKELADAGYAMEPAPTRFCGRTIAIILAVVTVLGILLGCLFFQQYPMDWQAVTDAPAPEAEAVRADLLALGFPEEVLDDLSGEDLTACAGATDLHTETSHGIFPDEFGQDTQSQYEATSIALLLPGQRVRVFFHFRLSDAMDLPGTQAIWMRTERSTSDYASMVAEIADSFSGSLLYRENGITCRGSIAETAFSNGRCYAGFSLPDGTDRRGYVTFEVTVLEDRLELLGFWFFFSCRSPAFPVLYPSQTALDWETEGGGSLFFDEYVDIASYFLFVSEGKGSIRDSS